METEQYEVLVHEQGSPLRYIIDMHIHADHISGARRRAARRVTCLGDGTCRQALGNLW
jgi:glyoxylase-like metal-dependent hydrolase (beta-lactamase superfamily II)